MTAFTSTIYTAQVAAESIPALGCGSCQDWTSQRVETQVPEKRFLDNLPTETLQGHTENATFQALPGAPKNLTVVLSEPQRRADRICTTRLRGDVWRLAKASLTAYQVGVRHSSQFWGLVALYTVRPVYQRL